MVSLLCWAVYELVVWGADELAVLVLLPEMHAASNEYPPPVEGVSIVYP